MYGCYIVLQLLTFKIVYHEKCIITVHVFYGSFIL